MNHKHNGAKPRRTWSATDLINKWTRKLPDEISRSLPWDVLDQLVSGLSPDSKLPIPRLYECIRTRDVGGLFSVQSALDVTVYTSPDLLIQDRLVVDLFSKFDFADSPFNKREKALLRFSEGEVMCREANRRILRTQGTHDNELNCVIHQAIRDIERLLGEFDLNEMLSYSRFGPGASLCVNGPYTTEYFKLCCSSPTVSSEVLPYVQALVRTDPLWGAYLCGMDPKEVWSEFSFLPGVEPCLTIVNNNKVTFVPKNAKTERSIAIEPYFNIFFQLGVGGMIRNRLYKRAGINLDSQERNQLNALKGSLTQELATIDFSMASDTISRECVRLLLPPVWFDHLDRLRSKTYCLLGREAQQYEKFSTMGNGFTFELETLIFYSIACAASKVMGVEFDDLTVYGDDVVLDSRVYDLFVKVCSFLGFSVNEEKSFRTGSFRESCGEDFLNGIRVRPVFCKELGTVQHIASLANRLSELNRSVGFGSRCNDMLDRTVSFLHSRIPKDVARLIVGPPSESTDSYIHTTCPQRLAASELVRWNCRLYAWEYPRITFTATQFQRRNDAVMVLANRSLAVKPAAIPSRQEIVVEAISQLSRRHPLVYVTNDGQLMQKRFSHALADFYSERTPVCITGRNVGKYTLGKNLFWSFPK